MIIWKKLFYVVVPNEIIFYIGSGFTVGDFLDDKKC